MEENISSDNGIPDVTGRKNCSYHISIDSHIHENLWKYEGIVHGLTWETLSWSLYLGHPLKVIATKVDVGFLRSPGPRLLGKLLMCSEFFRVVLIINWLLKMVPAFNSKHFLECKWF